MIIRSSVFFTQLVWVLRESPGNSIVQRSAVVSTDNHDVVASKFLEWFKAANPDPGEVVWFDGKYVKIPFDRLRFSNRFASFFPTVFYDVSESIMTEIIALLKSGDQSDFIARMSFFSRIDWKGMEEVRDSLISGYIDEEKSGDDYLHLVQMLDREFLLKDYVDDEFVDRLEDDLLAEMESYRDDLSDLDQHESVCIDIEKSLEGYALSRVFCRLQELKEEFEEEPVAKDKPDWIRKWQREQELETNEIDRLMLSLRQ